MFNIVWFTLLNMVLTCHPRIEILLNIDIFVIYTFLDYLVKVINNFIKEKNYKYNVLLEEKMYTI